MTAVPRSHPVPVPRSPWTWRRTGNAARIALLGVALPLVLTGCGLAGAGAAAGGPAATPDRVEAPRSGSPPSASPSPSAGIPERGTGRFQYAAGGGPAIGATGTVMRFRVGVERASAGSEAGPQAEPVVNVEEFAAVVAETLGAPQGWASGGRWRFQHGTTGPYDFTVYLATPRTTDRLCAPLRTDGAVSCRQGARVVLNLTRWQKGVRHYDADLDTYRRYMVNHEIGHRLGHGHEVCPGRGEPAPVMQQQTLRLAGCRSNPWPYLDGEPYHGPPGGYDG